MNEDDALYEALVWALEMDAEATVAEKRPGVSLFRSENGARAVLDAARWFAAHEHSAESQGVAICTECYWSPTDRTPHESTCTVGRWANAARKAGLA